MLSLLTEAQQARQCEARAFAARCVGPAAAEWDRAGAIPADAVAELAEAGYLGATVPERFGGLGWDTVSFGLLHEAIGRWSASLADLLTVQSMVAMTVLKWGREMQQTQWMSPLARGEMIGAFALTEPGGGSDLQALQTRFDPAPGGGWTLDGEKTWISFGQTAKLFLVFGMAEGQPLAAVIPRDAAGIAVEPITGMLGFRAAGLARVRFSSTPVPPEQALGKPGAALRYIAPLGLQYGRLSTASSATGLLRGCFEEALARAGSRQVGAQRVGDFGAVRAMLARMGADVEAAQWLCFAACQAQDERRPEAFTAALTAKYFASRAATRGAADAAQIWGAAGCCEESAVARYYRDARVMEIIEGTTQVHEDLLAASFLAAGGPGRLASPVNP